MEHKLSLETSKAITLLKFIAIILVVYLHAGGVVNTVSADVTLSGGLQYFQYLINQLFARISVPILFLVSGYLLYRKPFTWVGNIKKKCKTILIPYFFWNCLWILIFYIAQGIPALQGFFNNEDTILRGISITEWLSWITGYPNPLLYTIWFLRDLFFMNLISVIMKKFVDRFPKAVLIILLLLYLSDFSTSNVVTKHALFFFTLGYYIVKYDVDIDIHPSLKKDCLAVGYVLLVLALAAVEYNSETIFIIHNLVVLIGVVWLWYIVSCLNHALLKCGHTYIYKLSGYSFCIYCCHQFSLTFLRKFSSMVLPRTNFIMLLEYLLLPAFLCCAIIVVAAFVKKHLPVLYGFVFGSR